MTRFLRPLRVSSALLVLIVLLVVGVGIVAGFTAWGEPPRFVIWLILVWLLALCGAVLAYGRTLRDGDL